MTFEEKMQRLDEIVKIMSDNKLPLEETINIFEEGQKLIKDQQKRPSKDGALKIRFL